MRALKTLLIFNNARKKSKKISTETILYRSLYVVKERYPRSVKRLTSNKSQAKSVWLFFMFHAQDFVLRLRFARVLTSHSKRHCRFSVLRLVVRLDHITKALRTLGGLANIQQRQEEIEEDFK
ncbi:hypothetical protein BWD14_00455 [Leptospira santarosai]|uniref:Uncharacterized protein n=1 Tax=Leptospira santarosai TaxID=28183 RepID=A0AB73LVN8_9LEPT|nr:hypothetical protein BWD14_00455 [Leptospira santarosai]